MGNKKNSIWVVELFTSVDKMQILKVYEFSTIKEIAYVLNVEPSTVSNYYHKLIKARGLLKFVNIYQQPLLTKKLNISSK
jgi:Mn-dependent DtxR family transcriptional regulator